MSQQPITPDVDSADEELVAYLDGELEAGNRAQVERRLADDAAFRTRLRLLQRTWDALDVLGRADVGEKFTRTTVEFVAVKAAEDVVQEQSRRNQKRTWSWIGWAASAVIAAAAGWLVLANVLDRPNQQLLRDLAVIQRVDEYRNADSFEFVQAVEESGLFAAELESELPATGAPAANEIVPDRAGQVAKLRPEEKAKLIQRNERFLALSPAEQDRLRKFHEKISSASESQQLVTALGRYSQWLKTLTPQQQAELVGLSIDERLAKIREIQQDQVKAHFWQLAWQLERDDLEMIYAWMEDLVWRHQLAILARLDSNSTARFYRTIDPGAQRGLLLLYVFGQRGTQASELLPAAAAEDFAQLAARLPASLQLQLSAQKTDEERRDLIITCARVAFWSRHAPPLPSDEELRRYFATLDAADVERLEKMDPQQMKRELTRMYQFRRPRGGRGRGSEGFGDPGRGFGSPQGDVKGAPPRASGGSKSKPGGETTDSGRDESRPPEES
ncbi:MAG TPA: hypothetical protein VMP01_12045 [Pirellulaceae bacterium]|nr:hypothetical protein [Pirellulaceae bacterium]